MYQSAQVLYVSAICIIAHACFFVNGKVKVNRPRVWWKRGVFFCTHTHQPQERVTRYIKRADGYSAFYLLSLLTSHIHNIWFRAHFYSFFTFFVLLGKYGKMQVVIIYSTAQGLLSEPPLWMRVHRGSFFLFPFALLVPDEFSPPNISVASEKEKMRSNRLKDLLTLHPFPVYSHSDPLSSGSWR